MARKEFAKFFAGFAASQLLTHAALAASAVQFTLFGISYTPGFNAISAAVWSVALTLLADYAWTKK